MRLFTLLSALVFTVISALAALTDADFISGCYPLYVIPSFINSWLILIIIIVPTLTSVLITLYASVLIVYNINIDSLLQFCD